MGSKKFKIATWNINSVRLRSGLVEQFLKDYQPDVLCLQETKCANDQFPSSNFSKLGYEHTAIHGQKGYHGVATLSRLPLSHSESHDFCEIGDARHVRTIVHAGNQRIGIENFYVPAGGDEPDTAKNPKFAHKLKFLDEMQEIHATPSDEEDARILVGDLNIAPLENDVWSHKQLLKVVSHTPVETETLEKLRKDTGWSDLVRTKIPATEKLFTWWSYRSREWNVSDRGRRLDHIWGSQNLEGALEDVTVLREARGWERPSDHVPVIATFNF
ncbi:MAG: exodeoxyribonuclease III [Pseudomonadota bacterium]